PPARRLRRGRARDPAPPRRRAFVRRDRLDARAAQRRRRAEEARTARRRVARTMAATNRPRRRDEDVMTTQFAPDVVLTAFRKCFLWDATTSRPGSVADYQAL